LRKIYFKIETRRHHTQYETCPEFQGLKFISNIFDIEIKNLNLLELIRNKELDEKILFNILKESFSKIMKTVFHTKTITKTNINKIIKLIYLPMRTTLRLQINGDEFCSIERRLESEEENIIDFVMIDGNLDVERHNSNLWIGIEMIDVTDEYEKIRREIIKRNDLNLNLEELIQYKIKENL
jgi:hypothetical protein